MFVHHFAILCLFLEQSITYFSMTQIYKGPVRRQVWHGCSFQILEVFLKIRQN